MGRSAANVDRGCRVEAAAQMDNGSSGSEQGAGAGTADRSRDRGQGTDDKGSW